MKQKLHKNDQLANRLVNYTLTAGALAGLTGNVAAQVSYSGPQDVTLNLGSTVSLDLDGDATFDFNFSLGYFSYGTTSSSFGVRYAVMMPATGAYSNSWIAGYTLSSRLMVMGLDDAGVIDSAAPGWTNTSGAAPLGAFGDRYFSYYGPSYTYIDVNGNFPGQTRFAGIRFMIGGNLHYGWLRVSLDSAVSELIIHDWAYETTPGAGIVTDGAGPVATLIPDVPPRTNIQEVNVNITFDEQANGLDISDFTVFNGTAQSLTEITPGLEYNLVVTAGVHGTVSVTLPEGVVTDMYGNGNEEYLTSWFYDDRIPTTTMTPEYGDYTNMPTQEVSIVFSEGVVALELSDFIITNGTAANLTELVIDTEFTVEITASAEGTVIVELPAGAVLDYGSNPNELVSIEWTYDATPPEVTLDVPEALSADQMQVVSITFNEEVEGFELGDIVVSNGSAANLIEVTPGLDYTVEVTAAADGEVIVEIPSAAVTDLASNENGANETSWIYDGTAPIVGLVSSLSGTTGEVMATITISANEPIVGLELGDLTVTNGTASNLVVVTPGLEYTVDVTATAGGAVSVELPVDAVTDEAGNGNALVSVNWTYDDTVPTAQLAAGAALTNLSVVTVSIDFSEEVSGLELTDFNVTNGTATNLVEVTAGLAYTVDVTATADGAVEVELIADAVEDASGNGNASVSVSWEYDGTAPSATVDAGGGATINDETTTISITFDEEVEGLELTDISVTNGTADNLVEVTAGTSYTVDITATAEGEVSVEVNAGAVTDAAGNENAAASDNYIYEIIEGLDSHLSDGIRIYPNPSEGMLNIELERESTIRILTTSGRLVIVKNLVTNEVLDMSNLSQGVYILQVENETGISYHRFTIK